MSTNHTHNTIKDLHGHLYRQEVRAIIHIDLSNFFGSIDHGEAARYCVRGSKTNGW